MEKDPVFVELRNEVAVPFELDDFESPLALYGLLREVTLKLPPNHIPFVRLPDHME